MSIGTENVSGLLKIPARTLIFSYNFKLLHASQGSENQRIEMNHRCQIGTNYSEIKCE